MTFAPQRSIPDHPPGTLILFKIIGRRSWDELQRWHKALPGSRVEHVLKGIFVLHVPTGVARECVR